MGEWDFEPGTHIIAKDQPDQPAATAGFRLNHLMLRIKDPAVSIPFYRDVVGLRRVFTFNAGPITIYYMGYPKHGWSEQETFEKMQKRDGLLELIHVHGTEKDKDFKYVHGNEAPHWGFGHIGLTVPDVPAAVKHFEKHNVELFKPLGVATNATIPVPDGMVEIVPGFKEVYRQIAMIRDPDGYFIELVPQTIDKH